MKTSIAADLGSFLLLSILGCLGKLIRVLRVNAFSLLRSASSFTIFCDPPRNSVKGEHYPSSVYSEVLSPVPPRLVPGSQETPALHLIASDH